ncbi:CPBP family glutamic-type intramembrane protease [Enterococcus sp. DIV0876]|uniref:CPBP family glutamic-type intramembrane protease n=1 Tax=Enterococcus sp. DIV0876 TaxID=2774633 RepID=UPI003D2FB3D4
MLEHKQNQYPFPLLDSMPIISGGRLWGLVFGVALAEWLSVILGDMHAGSEGLAIVISVVQLVLPLSLFIGLFTVVGQQRFRHLFAPISFRDIGFTLVMFVLGTIYSAVMTNILTTTANTNVMSGSSLNHMQRLLLFAINEGSNIILLFNEELLAIISFLALAALARHYGHMTRNTSIIIGWVGSILLFGLLHYQAYDWNLVQMFLLIGMSRVFDTAIYIRTKNIMLSFLVHFIYDTIIFAVAMFG